MYLPRYWGYYFWCVLLNKGVVYPILKSLRIRPSANFISKRKINEHKRLMKQKQGIPINDGSTFKYLNFTLMTQRNETEYKKNT